jgi:very-short-patch-repair endonuclease
MRKNQLHNIEALKGRRKELRSNLTSAEAFLWTRLQKGQLAGRKFRRQHSFGNFILDFYCPSEKLCVELDGMPHFTDEGIEYDKKRTEYLTLMGIREIRFENWEVFEKADEILEKIRKMFRK